MQGESYQQPTAHEHKPAAIVFVHGLASSAYDWHRQCAYFVPLRPCLTPELIFHGDNKTAQQLRPYAFGLYALSIKQMARDVLEQIRAQHQGAVHLVGLSLGGMVCSELARLAPQSVRSVTLVNSPPRFGFSTLNMALERAYYLLLSRDKIYEYMSYRLYPKPDQQDLRHELIAHQANLSNAQLASLFLAMWGWRADKPLYDVPCAKLIITGERDYWSEGLRKRILRKVQGCEFAFVTDSGHATPMDSPAKLNALIQDFIARHDA